MLAYLALFSEIGISLLVTTLIGVLVGHWVDEQLGTLPVFMIVGFLRRRRGRDPDDRQVGQSVPEDVRLAGRSQTGGGGSERGVEPRSCVWSKRVERAGRDPRGRRGPQRRRPKKGRGLSARWFAHHRARDRLQHRRARSSSRRSPRRSKAPAPGDACAFPVCFIEGTLEFPAPHVVWAPEGSHPPKRQRARSSSTRASARRS